MRNRRTKNRKTTTKNPALEFIILLPEDPRYQSSRSSLPEDGMVEGLLFLEKRAMASLNSKNRFYNIRLFKNYSINHAKTG